MRILLILLLVGISLTTFAQNELSIQGSVEIPLDELKWVFNPGTGIVATFSKIKRDDNSGTAMGLSAGWSHFVPKQDMFYYLVNENSVGTISYQNMEVYQLSAQVRWDLLIKKNVELFAGGELGLYYTKVGFRSNDQYQSVDARTFTGRAALAPKAGINYQLSEKLGVFFQTKYLISIAKTDIHDETVNFYWNNSVGVNFRF